MPLNRLQSPAACRPAQFVCFYVALAIRCRRSALFYPSALKTAVQRQLSSNSITLSSVGVSGFYGLFFMRSKCDISVGCSSIRKIRFFVTNSQITDLWSFVLITSAK